MFKLNTINETRTYSYGSTTDEAYAKILNSIADDIQNIFASELPKMKLAKRIDAVSRNSNNIIQVKSDNAAALYYAMSNYEENYNGYYLKIIIGYNGRLSIMPGLINKIEENPTIEFTEGFLSATSSWNYNIVNIGNESIIDYTNRTVSQVVNFTIKTSSCENHGLCSFNGNSTNKCMDVGYCITSTGKQLGIRLKYGNYDSIAPVLYDDMDKKSPCNIAYNITSISGETTNLLPVSPIYVASAWQGGTIYSDYGYLPSIKGTGSSLVGVGAVVKIGDKEYVAQGSNSSFLIEL